MKEKFERPLSSVVFLQLPPFFFSFSLFFFLFFFPSFPHRDSFSRVDAYTGRMMEADMEIKILLPFEYVACCYPRLLAEKISSLISPLSLQPAVEKFEICGIIWNRELWNNRISRFNLLPNICNRYWKYLKMHTN